MTVKSWISIVLMLASNAFPETDFFERIRTERVESDPSVVWKNFGPGMSGYCENFWCHPSDTNVMFMGPDMHVSYGTWDGGDSWHTLKDSDGTGQEMKRVLDVEFSRQNPDFGMAIDWNGWVYETTDRGRSWTKTSELSRSWKEVGIDPNDPESFSKGWYYEQMGTRLSELAVDPSNDHIWYIGAGDFWNIKANHKSTANLHGTRFDYADYGYICKSTDRGKTWRKIRNGLPEDLDVARIIVHPENSQHIIMATTHGIMLSTDGGLTWINRADGLPNNLPKDLTSFYDKTTGTFVLYLVEQTVYLLKKNCIESVGGVFKSTDGGKSWVSITGNLFLDLNAVDSPWENDRFYKTVAHWLGLSKAEAVERFNVLPKRALPTFNRIVVNPNKADEIYVTYNRKHDRTFGPGDVWRTLDGGRTWSVVARYGAYWKSGRGSAYWKSRNNPVGTNVTFAHLQSYMDTNPGYSGNRMMSINAAGAVFIGLDQQTLKTTDKGESWKQVDDFETAPGSEKWIGRGGSNLPGRFMLLETGIPERKLLCSGEHGLWQTTDSGNWRDQSAVAVEQIEGQVHPDGAHSISTVAVHPRHPDTIYTLSWRQEHRGKLRRTTNGGKTWENIATIFDADSGIWQNVASQNSLLIDPVDPDNMYFCATYQRISEVHNGPGVELSKGGYGFYRSSDGGYTWTLMNSGLPADASVRRIAMHPDHPEILFAALNNDGGGLYVSLNRGGHWEPVSIPDVIRAVNNVFIDRTQNYILISTGRNNGSYEEGGVWRSRNGGESWEQIFKAPFVWQAESSPVNPDLIVISAAGQIVRRSHEFMNPGIYLSEDAGETWRKINRGLGQPDKIVDVKPDPYDESQLWCASWGCGWFKAEIK
ncbi:hypothetical protein EGM51_05415 [Verrucomicrobia bacterium S94]|nr:hypothetical protein EGM51_05415 [Verrucomicrobia bacterium S94]